MDNQQQTNEDDDEVNNLNHNLFLSILIYIFFSF
jgi:hypothetical protein